MTYLTFPLQTAHKKKEFDCGKPALTQYLKTQAKQDLKKRLSVCFILADDENTVKGYYTLSNTSIDRDLVPEGLRHKLPPNYLDLPATFLGRLAVDQAFKGRGLGQYLLMDALKRSYDTSVSSIGSIAVIVDPLDQEAEQLYLKYGFIKLPDSGKMFLAMASIAPLFS